MDDGTFVWLERYVVTMRYCKVVPIYHFATGMTFYQNVGDDYEGYHTHQWLEIERVLE